MNFRGEKRRAPIVNLTPLIDALFLLLIFFMVSSTFRDRAGIPLELPGANTGESNESTVVEVEVDKEGRILIEGESVSASDLRSVLEAALDRSESRDLLLRADQGVPYGSVIDVMDAAREARASRLVMATENRRKGQSEERTK
jgi:biopolymer transport protein ExbD